MTKRNTFLSIQETPTAARQGVLNGVGQRVLAVSLTLPVMGTILALIVLS